MAGPRAQPRFVRGARFVREYKFCFHPEPSGLGVVPTAFATSQIATATLAHLMAQINSDWPLGEAGQCPCRTKRPRKRWRKAEAHWDPGCQATEQPGRTLLKF